MQRLRYYGFYFYIHYIEPFFSESIKTINLARKLANELHMNSMITTEVNKFDTNLKFHHKSALQRISAEPRSVTASTTKEI